MAEEKKIFKYKKKKRIYIALAWIFGIITFFYMIFIVNDPTLPYYHSAIFVWLIVIVVAFSVMHRKFFKLVNVPYIKCCKTCLHCREHPVLNKLNHTVSKSYYCTEFDDDEDVLLETFIPCKMYELDDWKLKDENGKN